MSDSTVVAIITSIPGVLAALFSGLTVLISNKNKNKLDNIHKDINGKVDQLVVAAKDSGRIAEQLIQKSLSKKEQS